MALDLPNSPSVGDVFVAGSDSYIKFWEYAGSLIWKRLSSTNYIYDGEAPSSVATAFLDGGQA